MCYVFIGLVALLISASLIQESKERCIYIKLYAAVMFSGRFVAWLISRANQESKERCIYIKLYAVCYVFRAVRCWLISPR